MDQDNTQNSQSEPQTTEPQPAAPAPQQPTTQPQPEQPAQQAPQPAEPQATPTENTGASATAQPAEGCKCPTLNAAEWDKQKKQLDKTFYKTFSPRLFHYPLSFSIDVERARKAAANKGYKVPENPMILDTGGMFWGTVMLEVTGANAEDKNVVSFSAKNIYTKVSRRPWKEITQDIAELKQEMGSEPAELYFWWTSCPKCVANKEEKAVLVAVEAAALPAAAPSSAPEAPQPPAATPEATPQPTAPPEAPAQPPVAPEQPPQQPPSAPPQA